MKRKLDSRENKQQPFNWFNKELPGRHPSMHLGVGRWTKAKNCSVSSVLQRPHRLSCPGLTPGEKVLCKRKESGTMSLNRFERHWTKHVKHCCRTFQRLYLFNVYCEFPREKTFFSILLTILPRINFPTVLLKLNLWRMLYFGVSVGVSILSKTYWLQVVQRNNASV